MSDVACVSNVQIERKPWPLRIAYFAGESQPGTLQYSWGYRAALQDGSGGSQGISRVNLDYVIAATAG